MRVFLSDTFGLLLTVATSPPFLSVEMSNTSGFFLKTLSLEKVPPLAENLTVTVWSSQTAYRSTTFSSAGMVRELPAATPSPVPSALVFQPLKTLP